MKDLPSIISSDKENLKDATSSSYDTYPVVENPTALVILNMPIKAKLTNQTNQLGSSLFEHLWDASTFRICADGGANRLYDATVSRWSSMMSQSNGWNSEEQTGNNPYIPNLIRGDFDSIRLDVKLHYQKLGCQIECDPNQDCNDLDKALSAIVSRQNEVEQEAESAQKWNVYVYGAFDGRFDQTMASIQALFKWKDKFASLVLYNENTSAQLLKGAGVVNNIRTYLEYEGPSCGLLPIGSRCDWVHTTGLKWNLHGESMEFGGLISTSNIIQDAVVTVRSSHPLVWTTELRRSS